jgi:hypothetical protein
LVALTLGHADVITHKNIRNTHNDRRQGSKGRPSLVGRSTNKQQNKKAKHTAQTQNKSKREILKFRARDAKAETWQQVE